MDELQNIRFVSRVGQNNHLISFDNNNNLVLTEFFHQLEKDASEFKPDLLVLDTVADLFNGNENSRIQVREFIQNACGRLAKLINCAVLLCAHPSESGMQKGTGSGGSTAWHNSLRSRWYLQHSNNKSENQNSRILTKVKANYGASGVCKKLKWQDGIFVTESSEAKPTDNLNDIIKIIESEALKGNFYTVNQFAQNFESQLLVSNRSLNSKLVLAAKQSVVKFFTDPSKYGVHQKQSNYGYLCTDNSKIETKDGVVKIIATHLKINTKLTKITLEEKAND